MFDNLLISMNAVLPLMICMGAGYIFRCLKIIDEPFCRKCNTFCFKTFLPLMIFMNVINSDMQSAVQPDVFVFAVASVLIVFLLTFFTVPKMLRADGIDNEGNPIPVDSRRAVIIQGIFRSNYVIFGSQVVANVYGVEDAAVASVLSAIVVPLYNVLAVITLEYYTNSKKGIKPVLIGIAKNPLILGAIAAFIFKFTGITMPAAIHKGLSNLSSIATPLSLVVLGGTFRFSALKKNTKALLLGVVGKIVVTPLLVVPIAILCGFRDANLLTLMIVFASPAAVSSYTMADAYGHDAELAGQQIVMTSIFSMFSVFIFIFVLRSLGFLA